MGKAARWFKGLLGLKTDHKDSETHSQTTKKRWSFAGKSSAKPASPAGVIPAMSASDAAWLRSYIAGSGAEQNKHAIAVAAATAAAADAAVAAAQAAVAVVRLTSHGGAGKRDRWAAAKIQAVFRGFLARKALRALRGLVKIQALVRGFLVRKRAAATLHSMQALIRAQTAVRTQRARRSFNKNILLENQHNPRKSITDRESQSKRISGSFYDSNGGFDDDSPKIVEIDTCRPRSRSRRYSAATDCCSGGGDDHHHQNPVASPLVFPGRIAVPECHDCFDYYAGDFCRFSTAHNTPRFALGAAAATPVTPAKSVCGGEWPSYMASTQSFSAKLRSHSAPRQRPEKKRLSLNEILAARNSVSGVRMHRSSYALFPDPPFQ